MDRSPRIRRSWPPYSGTCGPTLSEPLLRGAEEAEDKRIKSTIQEAVTGIARKYSEALLPMPGIP